MFMISYPPMVRLAVLKNPNFMPSSTNRFISRWSCSTTLLRYFICRNLTNPHQINNLLSGVFTQMQQLGEPVLKPFLQDVVQFTGLTQTLFKTAFSHPLLIAQVIPQVGIVSLVDWTWHYINLGLFTVLFKLGVSWHRWIKYLPPVGQYYYHRTLDKWQYGSGCDLANSSSS